MGSAESVFGWGPIGEPIKVGAAGPEDPVYRDNAFLTFWSLGEEPVYGEVHVSTSPNSDGRCARFTIYRNGAVTNLVEPLDPGSFTSDSIDFDPRGRATVKADGVAAEFSYTPRFVAGNYTENAVLGSVEESTMSHYQQGVDVTASLDIGGTHLDLSCQGFRDRTWGYRDEPKQWIDGFGFCVTTDDFDFTCIRNMDNHENTVTDGFLLSAEGSLALTDIVFHYDPVMLHHADLTFTDGSERTITNVGRQYTPIWFPMGPVRSAPAMTCWSEYCTYDLWGSAGQGIVGHWVRRLV
jgi:hypothetical protein